VSRKKRRQETSWLASAHPVPSALHFKSGALRGDGAECGAMGAEFTGDPELATCTLCLGALLEAWR
jgi:hypothetical protein